MDQSNIPVCIQSNLSNDSKWSLFIQPQNFYNVSYDDGCPITNIDMPVAEALNKIEHGARFRSLIFILGSIGRKNSYIPNLSFFSLGRLYIFIVNSALFDREVFDSLIFILSSIQSKNSKDNWWSLVLSPILAQLQTTCPELTMPNHCSIEVLCV